MLVEVGSSDVDIEELEDVGNGDVLVGRGDVLVGDGGTDDWVLETVVGHELVLIRELVGVDVETGVVIGGEVEDCMLGENVVLDEEGKGVDGIVVDGGEVEPSLVTAEQFTVKNVRALFIRSLFGILFSVLTGSTHTP